MDSIPVMWAFSSVLSLPFAGYFLSGHQIESKALFYTGVALAIVSVGCFLAILPTLFANAQNAGNLATMAGTVVFSTHMAASLTVLIMAIRHK